VTYVGFPLQSSWIPDLAQLGDSGQVILDVAGQSLDYFPYEGGTRGTPYARRVLTTGQNVPMVPEQDGQLVVSLFEMALGRAGEQRFQFFKGTMGAYAQKFVRYQVQLARTSPVITGGIAPRMPRADVLEDYARELWTDAYIVWSALLAMCLGGIVNAQTGEQLSPAPITQDNVLVGPVALDPPQGGLAVARIEVVVQM
jgi:hypothetical protein